MQLKPSEKNARAWVIMVELGTDLMVASHSHVKVEKVSYLYLLFVYQLGIRER